MEKDRGGSVMPYYEDEILKKLVLGEKCTERELRIFIENVNDIVITLSHVKSSI